MFHDDDDGGAEASCYGPHDAEIDVYLYLLILPYDKSRSISKGKNVTDILRLII